jgi:hypothetical protein
VIFFKNVLQSKKLHRTLSDIFDFWPVGFTRFLGNHLTLILCASVNFLVILESLDQEIWTNIGWHPGNTYKHPGHLNPFWRKTAQQDVSSFVPMIPHHHSNVLHFFQNFWITSDSIIFFKNLLNAKNSRDCYLTTWSILKILFIRIMKHLFYIILMNLGMRRNYLKFFGQDHQHEIHA